MSIIYLEVYEMTMTTTMTVDRATAVEAMRQRILDKAVARNYVDLFDQARVFCLDDTVGEALTQEQVVIARETLSQMMSVTDQNLLNLRYGLESGKMLDPEECAHRLNTTVEMFNAKERSVLRKLEHPVWQDRIRYRLGVMPEAEYVPYDTAIKIGEGKLPMPTDSDALRGILVEALRLDPMYTVILKNAGVVTVGDLVERDFDEIRRISQSRQDMFIEIITTLSKYGLSLHP